MKALRGLAVLVGIFFVLLAIPGVLLDLHQAWWENTFHVLAFGCVAAYAIYFGVTGRHKVFEKTKGNGLA